MARRAKRKKSKQKPTCSYANCCHPNDELLPCEQPGRCPNYVHVRCCGRDKIICSVCVGKQKRSHDKTPTDVAKNTRSVTKRGRISRGDPVRVALFQHEHTDNTPSTSRGAVMPSTSSQTASAVVTTATLISPNTPISPSRIVRPSVFVRNSTRPTAPVSVPTSHTPATPSDNAPVTPANRVDGNVDTPVEDGRRPGRRGGRGRAAALHSDRHCGH